MPAISTLFPPFDKERELAYICKKEGLSYEHTVYKVRNIVVYSGKIGAFAFLASIPFVQSWTPHLGIVISLGSMVYVKHISQRVAQQARALNQLEQVQTLLLGRRVGDSLVQAVHKVALLGKVYGSDQNKLSVDLQVKIEETLWVANSLLGAAFLIGKDQERANELFEAANNAYAILGARKATTDLSFFEGLIDLQSNPLLKLALHKARPLGFTIEIDTLDRFINSVFISLDISGFPYRWTKASLDHVSNGLMTRNWQGNAQERTLDQIVPNITLDKVNTESQKVSEVVWKYLPYLASLGVAVSLGFYSKSFDLRLLFLAGGSLLLSFVRFAFIPKRFAVIALLGEIQALRARINEGIHHMGQRDAFEKRLESLQYRFEGMTDVPGEIKQGVNRILWLGHLLSAVSNLRLDDYRRTGRHFKAAFALEKGSNFQGSDIKEYKCFTRADYLTKLTENRRSRFPTYIVDAAEVLGEGVSLEMLDRIKRMYAFASKTLQKKGGIRSSSPAPTAGQGCRSPLRRMQPQEPQPRRSGPGLPPPHPGPPVGVRPTPPGAPPPPAGGPPSLARRNSAPVVPPPNRSAAQNALFAAIRVGKGLKKMDPNAVRVPSDNGSSNKTALSIQEQLKAKLRQRRGSIHQKNPGEPDSEPESDID